MLRQLRKHTGTHMPPHPPAEARRQRNEQQTIVNSNRTGAAMALAASLWLARCHTPHSRCSKCQKHPHTPAAAPVVLVAAARLSLTALPALIAAVAAAAQIQQVRSGLVPTLSLASLVTVCLCHMTAQHTAAGSCSLRHVRYRQRLSAPCRQCCGKTGPPCVSVRLGGRTRACMRWGRWSNS